MIHRDGDDDDDTKGKQKEHEPMTGDYDLGDDVGTRVGEGKDDIEDETT